MKFLIDMNLSPVWCSTLNNYGWESKHWSEIGEPSATDNELFSYAKKHNYIIFTHDLDFGVLLALSEEQGPSVIQVRTSDTMPDKIENVVVKTIIKYEKLLNDGALISIDRFRSRIRVFPLKEDNQ